MACFAASTYRACPLNCSAWWSKKFKGWSANHQCQHQFGARAGIGRPRQPCIWSNIAGVQNCFNVTIQCWNLFLVIVNVTSQSWSWSWLKVSRRVQIRCLSSNSKVTVSHSPRAGMEVQGQMKRWHYNFWPCGRFNSVESTPFDIYGACQDVVRFPNSQEGQGTWRNHLWNHHHHHHHCCHRRHHHGDDQVQLAQDPDYDAEATYLNPPPHKLAVRLFEVNQVMIMLMILMKTIIYDDYFLMTIMMV